MRMLSKEESNLLIPIAQKHNLPFSLLKELIITSNDFLYSNETPGKRKEEYSKIIKLSIDKHKG